MAWIIYNKDTLEVLRIEPPVQAVEPSLPENEGLEIPIIRAVFNSEVFGIPDKLNVEYTKCIFDVVTGLPKWVIE